MKDYHSILIKKMKMVNIPDNKDVANSASDNTGSDYSMGSYMRDKTKR